MKTRAATFALVALTMVGVSITSLASDTRAKADTLQMSSDNLETGWYPNEPQLAPSAVTASNFGQLFDTQLTGAVYAQPLISQPTVLAVTEDDYAYGLSPTTGAIQWQRNFGPQADPLAQTKCGDIGANMGITGTPVIDPATDVAYFVAATDGGTGGATEFFMEAVNVQTGLTPANWPAGGVPIQGSADDDPGTVFNGQWQTQRPGLVLVNGVVYAGFGSQCDYGKWTGWMIGVSEATHSITTMWSSETNIDPSVADGGGAGIWQSGTAPVVDSQGNIYFSTGNGVIPSSPESDTVTSVHNFGEAVVELSATGGSLHVVDWFMPSDAPYLNQVDGDLGSGGAVALPASMGTPQEPNVLLEIGKEGVLYALNMNALGGYQQGAGGTDAVPSEAGPFGGVWSKPAVWPGDGGYIYIPMAGTVSFDTGGGSLNVFKRMVSDSGAVWFQEVGATSNSNNTFGFGSGAPIITSNGTASGSSLLWIVHDNDASGTNASLEAFNPIPQNPGPNGTMQEVWSYPIGTSSTFAEPGVDNGIVYVGTKDGTLRGFGILASSTPALTGDNVDFAPTTVAQSVTATAQFTATAPTSVTSFTVTGSAFTLGTPNTALPASLVTGQTITVPVTFTPNALGGLAGTLTANESGSTATVSLSGQGISASGPLSASPNVADFGVQPIGGSLVSQTVTFTNVSTSPVTITGFIAPRLPFAVTGAPTSPYPTLAANQSVSFTVDFSPPGSSGDFVHVFGGVAILETSAGNFGVPVSGSAAPPAQINIVPTTLDFGNVTVGSTATQSFNIGDQGGVPLTITASAPPMTNGFTATSSLTTGTVIDADASIQESVQFAPSSLGTVSATWTLEGDDGSGPQTVTMTGTGVAATPPPSGGGGGGGGGGPPPSAPAPASPTPVSLTITTLSGHVGTPLALSTSGDPDGGSVSFRANNGTATGCAVSGDSLGAKSAGTCIVTATKSAAGTTAAVSSSPTTITFAKKITTSPPRVITVNFGAKSSALSSGAEKELRAFAAGLVRGRSVICTGYAKGNATLAKDRAKAVANYLSSRTSVHLTLKSVTSDAVDRATVTTT